MAAEIVDERMLEGEIAELEKLVEQDKTNDIASQSLQDPTIAEALPEKYQGKSLSDIVRMHQEAEKLMGRQSSEVGELRRVVDEFISKQTELVAKKEEPQEIDFFSDPKTAINKSIETHPAFKQLEQLTAAQHQSTAKAQLMQKHPDAQELVSDSRFIEWVMASKIRQNLLIRADKEYDVESADELFSLWKERQSFVQQTASNEKTARKEAVSKASTGSTSVSSDGFKTKKNFRRADIVKLMVEDPDRYESLLPEIGQAYREGRVI